MKIHVIVTVLQICGRKLVRENVGIAMLIVPVVLEIQINIVYFA